MEQPLCKITLVCPPANADRIIELMSSLEPPIVGFTTWIAEGHGFGFGGATVSERVRGRVKRSVIVAVLERPEAKELLDLVEAQAAAPHLTYWIEPVESFGRMQRTSPPQTSAADARTSLDGQEDHR